MAATGTIEDKAAELKRLAEFYSTVTGTVVPDSVAKGAAEAWELAEDFGVMPAYASEERRADGQRVMTLRLALQTLEEFEEALMVSQVTGTVDLAWKQARTVWGILSCIGALGEAMWDALITIWSIGGLMLAVWWETGQPPDFAAIGSAGMAALTAAWSGIDEALALLLFAWKEENFRAMAKSVTKVRDEYVAKARKRAFPQSSTGRLRRRKVSVL